MRWMLLIVVLFSTVAVADECSYAAEVAAKKCNDKCSKIYNTWSDPDPVGEMDCSAKCDSKQEKAEQVCRAKSNKQSKKGG